MRIAAVLLCLLLAGQATAETLYGYRVLERRPQPRENFVQGLQIVDGDLYVSTGNYGESRLLRYDFADGHLEAERPLDPRLFGEGLVVVGDLVFQLTWRARLALVYEREDFKPRAWFRLPGQGWGLTYDGEHLIYSDGSDQLHFLDPSTGQHLHSVAVRSNGQPVPRLNELEWIDGKVWANVWGSDEIVIIDPESGTVTARLDLAGLLPDSDRQPGTDVLNGIARDPADGAIWVTGKRWPWLYRIELVQRDARGPQQDAPEPR
jgi:glutaminyl-peptide cyclotransferase